MGIRSGIEWCDASWTPLRASNLETGNVGWHCELASPGCQNCYSQRSNRRFGTRLPFVRRSREEVISFLDEHILAEPLRWRKPKKIFVCANTDLFGEWVPDEWIDRIFAVMALAPQHVFQVLTKRAKRMREYLCSGPRPEWSYWMGRLVDKSTMESVGRGFDLQTDVAVGKNYPLKNCWLGVSAEDQQRLDERVPELLATPAAVRFVSAEPLLAPLDFDGGMYDGPGYLRGWHTEPVHGRHGLDGECIDCPQPEQVQNPKIDWLIVGGESGPEARPMDADWARDILRQCRSAGVACFVKQMGAMAFDSARTERGEMEGLRLKDRKGGDPAEWPSDLRVREFPEVRG